MFYRTIMPLKYKYTLLMIHIASYSTGRLISNADMQLKLVPNEGQCLPESGPLREEFCFDAGMHRGMMGNLVR